MSSGLDSPPMSNSNLLSSSSVLSSPISSPGASSAQLLGPHDRHHGSPVAAATRRDEEKSTAVELQHLQTAKPFDVVVEVVEPGKTQLGSNQKKEDRMASLKKEIDLDDHTLEVDAFLAKWKVSLDRGLTSDEVLARQAQYGLNQLSPPKVTPPWVRFLIQMVTGFNGLLWVASFLAFLAYGLDVKNNPTSFDASNLYLAIALVVTIVLTGTFAFYQDSKSNDVMERFKSMLPPKTKVMRNGEKVEVEATELVPGDVVFVQFGDKLPADVRIMASSAVQVDNSSLTGESEAQSRSPECTDKNPMETKNLAFCGTSMVSGTCTAVVVLTGDNTLIGRIAGLASMTETSETPIAIEIHKFVLRITGIAFCIGILFIGIGFKVFQGQLLKNILFGIGIIVANVPEGLVATVTLCLTTAAYKMAQKNVLVKNLEAVETLGSTNTICSDKTGTLTQNKMTVQHAFFDNQVYTCIKGDTAFPTIKAAEWLPQYFGQSAAVGSSFPALWRIGVVCNRASFKPEDMQKPIAERATFGDATESGLIKYFEEMQTISTLRDVHKQVYGLPFNSKFKFQLSVHELPGDAAMLLVMKGAPERIMDRCTTVMMGGREVPMTAELRATLEAGNERLGELGERVLGFAHLKLDNKYGVDFEFDAENPDQANFPLTGMCFVGLISLLDPPREGVKEAVADCHTAGIKVIMVTGDHPITAKAIAQQVGIIRGETIEDAARRLGVTVAEARAQGVEVSAIVVTGTEVAEFVDADWDRVLKHPEIVFARTSPQQKLVIVENNQKRGGIVAVTGDGVNDSPALKQANIGIAMGITGSDVSKEAADMVLLDDNFASIINGVKEGRLIFDNLKKSIAYTLEHLMSEVVPYLAFFILQIPSPLTTVLILCIDLGTDIFPAMACAYEEPEADIMLRKPRNAQTDALVGWRLFVFAYWQIGLIQVIGVMTTYYMAFKLNGVDTSLLNFTSDDWQNKEIALVLGKTFAERQRIWLEAQSATFLSVVIVQWGGLLCVKTRKLSLLQQGLRNQMINLSLVVETIIAAIIIYTPGVQEVLGTTNVRVELWFIPMPFALACIVYDEIRKWIIRTYPGGWVEWFTYY